jgi:mannobiose 2-epimerase
MNFQVVLLVICVAAVAQAAPLKQHAVDYKAQLTEKILPYWLRTQDVTNGGFLLQDDLVKGPSTPREKQLVSQARMVWTFSHAHVHGFDKDGACLKAAENGYRFLTEKFFDRENGGYFWKTDLSGKPTSDRKILYGEAFVIYAFVEYHRATKNPEPLRRAMELYRVIQQRAHDAKNRGWTEHFTRDWKPLAPGDRSGEVEVVGLKSANAHLHVQEALAELYDVTRDAEVKKSLEEALDLNKRYFYPKQAGLSCFHRKPDWGEVTDASSAGLSYGHNVEFAWLMLRAEQVLGRAADWPHFHAHIDHALKFGYDHERGGLYNRGAGDQPATDKNKIWWVQSEMMAGLTEALKHKKSAAYEKALDGLIHFVNQFQSGKGRSEGIWMDTVTADGKPKSTALAHNWKANYHDVRALVMFVETFQ